jgi:hypothetical protein
MAQQPPPQLTPAALFDNQAKLDALRLQTYNRLLSAIHQKIRWAAQQQNGNQMTYYDVPEWTPGCPRYDVKDAILYLAWNLRHSGFTVLYMGANRLLIHWKDQTMQYYTEDSPIRQAMLAAAAAGPGSSSPKASATAAASKSDGKKRAGAYRPATADGVAGMLAQGAARRPANSGTTVTFI